MRGHHAASPGGDKRTSEAGKTFRLGFSVAACRVASRQNDDFRI